MIKIIYRLISCILVIVVFFACTPSEEPTSIDVPETEPTSGGDRQLEEDQMKETPEPSEAASEETAPAPSTDATEPPPAAGPPPALLDPNLAHEQAPSQFQALFSTTKGDFTISVTRDWAPQGADRFYNLVRVGFFTDIAFFRVLSGFMAQFGVYGDPEIAEAWRAARIPDDPVTQSNGRGYLSFATAGPGTRTTQLFINFGDNAGLDGQGFSPIGQVTEGMEVVDSLYADYGEGAPRGDGPNQQLIQNVGNSYLKKQFPKLDYIKSASIIE